MNVLLNLLFPKFCIGCNSHGTYVCSRCYTKFVFLKEQFCPNCFLPTIDAMTHTKCALPYGLDGSYSMLEYKGITKILIKDIKYRRMYSVIEDFFDNISSEHQKKITKTLLNYRVDYIQSIPLHSTREKLRGFNQADYISKRISALLSVPIINVLSRKINTRSQARIASKTERQKNIRGAFQYSGENKHSNKSILLIDDLFTTGSTSKEAAAVLKKHGFTRVFSCSLAHG